MDPSNSELLRTADGIGFRLGQQAIWHGNRCNWVGAQPVERQHGGSYQGVTYEALGPDLYSGTAGIALFLAELYSETGAEQMRRTALGAIRHALSRLDTIPAFARLGLFSGWIGVALAAVRVGILLDEPALLRQARDLLHRAAAESHDPGEFDLMAGRAGAITGLIVLNHILDASFLDFAARLGDELLETAAKTGVGYSWKTPGLRHRHNLTGFSHGTAGVGAALLELFQVTGETRYRHAASLAYGYERHWFAPECGNWPDFREDPASPSRRQAPRKFSIFWCHGAPGIALSRLRAYEILGDVTCKDEAIAALMTTRGSIRMALESWTGNFSLCHGLAGNAEVLSCAPETLNTEPAEDAGVASQVACYGMERYAERNEPWPCGNHSAETPNLMLGLAGIGHFYLRQYRPSIPSILILRKEAWSRGQVNHAAASQASTACHSR